MKHHHRHKREFNKKRIAFAIASLTLTVILLIIAVTLLPSFFNMQKQTVLCSRKNQPQSLVQRESCVSAEQIASLNQYGTANKKFAFLTFDDGPSSKTTELLAVLNQYQVKGNFFLVGNNIDGNEEAVKAIARQGSAVFVHSTTHNYEAIYASTQAFSNDITTTLDKIKQLGIAAPYMYRFPGGSNTGYIGRDTFADFKKLVHDKGMEYVDWNVDSGDASGNNPDTETIVATIAAQLDNKHYATILMHDAADKAATRAALPAIIKLLKANGFTICELPRGLSIPQFMQ